MPKDLPPKPPATPVTDCKSGLNFDGTAKDAPVDLAAVLLTSTVEAADRKVDPAAPPVAWCRDPRVVAMGAIYRANETTEGYLLAFSDAGRGLSVYRDTLGALFAKSDRSTKTKPPVRFNVTLNVPGEAVILSPQDRLPTPERAMQLMGGRVLAKVQTFGGKQLSLSRDVVK